MTHKFLQFLKPFTVLPALLMLCLIFGFSNQDGKTSSGLSQKVSIEIVRTQDTLLEKNYTEKEIIFHAKTIEYGVRKLTHITEYFFLALLVALPLYTYHVRERKLFVLTLLLCIVCASFDEFHQFFISGRSARVTDVCIDSIGIFIGSAMFTMFSTKLSKFR